MHRPVLFAFGLIAGMLLLNATVEASDNCQRYTGGKCKAGQKMAPKLPTGAVTHKATQPPAKGNHKGRDAYTPAQREKFMEEARQLCRKKFGAPSRVYRIDYKKNTVWCEPPSF